jgi:internalin A
LATRVLGLRIVSLRITDSTADDLSPIAQLSSLRSIVCIKATVGNLAPLAGLRKLEYFNLSASTVDDIAPLATIESLKRLDLNHAQVRDLTSLMEFENLEQLTLWNSLLTREQVESLQTALPNCKFKHDVK